MLFTIYPCDYEARLYDNMISEQPTQQAIRQPGRVAHKHMAY